MKSSRFFTLARRKLWAVLLFSFICSGITVSLLFLVSPVRYESGTTLYISNKSFEAGAEVSYSDMLAGRSLVDNYAVIVKSEMFAEAIIKRLNLEISPKDFTNLIQTEAVKNSNVLEIRVRHSDKETAEKIAEAFHDELYKNTSVISGTKYITALNRSYAARPLIAGKIAAVVLSFLFGFVSAICFLLAVHRGNHIIRTPEDVEKCLGLTVAGTIPDFRI